MTKRDEVAKRVAERLRDGFDPHVSYDKVWDALISSEMRVEELAEISLGRQKELFRLAAEKNDEWKRAELAEARVEELQEALRRIANPLASLQADAERQGLKINGAMAV